MGLAPSRGVVRGPLRPPTPEERLVLQTTSTQVHSSIPVNVKTRHHDCCRCCRRCLVVARAGASNPNLATFTSVARVSIYSEGPPAFLCEILPPQFDPLVEESLLRVLRSMPAETSMFEHFWDSTPKKRRRKYVQFMRALLRLGLVRIAVLSPKAQEREGASDRGRQASELALPSPSRCVAVHM